MGSIAGNVVLTFGARGGAYIAGGISPQISEFMARSVPAEEFGGMLVPLLSRDMPASSTITQELLGWQPTHPGLIEDIEQGHYFT